MRFYIRTDEGSYWRAAGDGIAPRDRAQLFEFERVKEIKKEFGHLIEIETEWGDTVSVEQAERLCALERELEHETELRRAKANGSV